MNIHAFQVLDQVSELFRDHSDLLKEFTYFLPDNVRDKAKQEIARISARRSKVCLSICRFASCYIE